MSRSLSTAPVWVASGVELYGINGTEHHELEDGESFSLLGYDTARQAAAALRVRVTDLQAENLELSTGGTVLRASVEFTGAITAEVVDPAVRVEPRERDVAWYGSRDRAGEAQLTYELLDGGEVVARGTVDVTVPVNRPPVLGT